MGFFNNSQEDEKFLEQKIETIGNAESNPFDLKRLSDVNREISNSINNAFSNSGLQSIFQEVQPFDRWEQWGNFRRGRGTSGLKAYPIPTLTAYSNCVKNEGSSVWDENGWWRCLLPKSKVTNSKEVTKEDIEADSSNKYGLFFKDYNDLLDWKLKMRDLTKKKEQETQKSNIQSIYDDYERDLNIGEANDVVRTSKSVYFKTLENGDAEETTKIKRVFRDGTTKTENTRKLIPKDGSLPIIEPLDEKDNKLTGWIWNDK